MAQNQLDDHPAADPCHAVLIGGSMGSIDVLLHLLPALKSPPFALIIVVHRKNTADSTLASLLALKTSLPLKEADDKDPIRPGHEYLAPADYHLLIEQDGTFSLDDSEKIHYSRPAIDVTFESAADVYGPHLAAILLSGANADGTAGLKAVKRAGGLTAVQRPESARAAFMPRHAIQHAPIDFVLDIEKLTRFIGALAGGR